MPDGSWQRKELPGPHSFEFWWASFRVYRAIFLLLDAAPPEVLDNYGEMLRGFSTLYGAEAWFLIYNADVRMRSEQFERLRRKAERDHAEATALGGSSGFKPDKPWFTVFALAAGDKEWWNDNLHRPVMLFLTRITSARTALGDGTAQPDLDHPTSSGSARGQADRDRKNRTKAKSRSPRARDARQDDGGAVFSRKGRRFCEDFNSSRGCSRGADSCPDLHACKVCKRLGHGSSSCKTGRPPSGALPVPPPPAGGGKGSKGRGDRSKDSR